MSLWRENLDKANRAPRCGARRKSEVKVPGREREKDWIVAERRDGAMATIPSRQFPSGAQLAQHCASFEICLPRQNTRGALAASDQPL